MEKEEIVGESVEQQETIEERRGRQEIEKELDDIKYAIKKEILSFELQKENLNQKKTNDRAKKAKLLIDHINKMRKLHEQQTALHDAFLIYKLKK